MSFSLETLEYAKLLELVSRHAQTPMGVDGSPICGRSRLRLRLLRVSSMKILFCIAILLFCCSFAYAHSCVTFAHLPDKEHSEKLNRIDNIFYGEVVAVTDLGSDSYLIKFKVLKVWKGDKTHEITAKYANPCGSPVFSVGTSLMVYGYASKNEPHIDVNCCNFNLFDDHRMRRELGEGIDLEQPSSEANSTSKEGFLSALWKAIVSFFS